MDVAGHESFDRDRAERLAAEYGAQLRTGLKYDHRRHEEKLAKQMRLTIAAFYDRDRHAFDEAQMIVSRSRSSS